MGTSAEVPHHPEHLYQPPYDAVAYKRITALAAEVKALEDEILDCPATNYHTRDRPRAALKEAD
jgi:hypothetical protein